MREKEGGGKYREDGKDEGEKQKRSERKKDWVEKKNMKRKTEKGG